MKPLHLVLKSEWYDKIASGQKTSEYRECKPYWNKRLGAMYASFHVWESLARIPWTVVFHRGYTSETMEFEIKDCDRTRQKNDLNLPEVWEIKLGNRIK